MKRIMIIGASILQLPAIQKAKELGYYVGVVDYNPKAIGIPYADEYFNISTIDEIGVVKAAKEFKPDGIITLATDMPMRAVARACEECGLPGISYETAIKATDKAEMIKAFEMNGVEHPWYYVVRDKNDIEKIANDISFPCVMKPTDSSGSRGVMLCNNINELKSCFDYSKKESRNGAVIIEEYLRGNEFSVEILVIDGKPNVIQITDKITTGAPHFVEMGHSQPTKQSVKNQDSITDVAIRACKAIGIKNGPAHAELILTSGGPKMVEIGARLGGDCITTHLVPLSTGIDMVKMTILLACGKKVDIGAKTNKGAAIRYFDCNKGVIQNIEGIKEAESLNGVEYVVFNYNVGDEIGNINSSVDRVGFVIACANTVDQANEICEKVKRIIKITVI